MLGLNPDTGLSVLQWGHAHCIKGHIGAYFNHEGKRNSRSSLPEFEVSLGYMRSYFKTKYFRYI